MSRIVYSNDCPFCKRDPYEYVDNGVGMEPVAINCCEPMMALYDTNDPMLDRIAALMCREDQRRERRGERLLKKHFPELEQCR